MAVEFLPHAVGESIGGVDEDEVEAPARRLAAEPSQRGRRRGPARRARRGRGARRCRAPARVSRSTRVACAAPRESASIAERAGAAVEVEDAGARRRSPSAEKIASRTRSEVGRTFQPRGATSRRPRSSPRVIRISATARGYAGSGRAAGAEAAAGGVEQRAERGGLERAVPRAAAPAPRSRASSRSRGVLGQLGDGEARQAVLAGAEDLALAAQREVDLGELEAVALAGDRLEPAPCRVGSRRSAKSRQ